MEADQGGQNETEAIGEDQVVKLSFKKDICGWLREMVRHEGEGQFQSILSQYLSAIEDITGAIGYEEALLVEELILKDSRFFKAGLWIEQTMEQAKIKLITTLMKEIKEAMRPLLEPYRLKELGPKSYYSVEKQVGKYYECSDSSYPGINYLVENAILHDGKEIWLRIEIDWNLFAGFCLFDPRADEGAGSQVDDMEPWKEEIAGFFKNMEEVENDDWWILWCYLPSGDQTLGKGDLLCPEFKTFNKSAIKLADKAYRQEMVKQYVDTIQIKLLTQLRIDV